MTSTPRKRADVSIPDISVIVPVLNEAGNIRPLIDEICDAFSGRDFEIIYVDDASTDDVTKVANRNDTYERTPSHHPLALQHGLARPNLAHRCVRCGQAI